MMTKSTEKLWKAYPGSQLHCEVTNYALNSYRIVMTLIGSDGNVIGEIEHYGRGILPQMKEDALERLVKLVEPVPVQ